MKQCSFCQRTDKEAIILFDGEHGGIICNICVAQCMNVIKRGKGVILPLRPRKRPL